MKNFIHGVFVILAVMAVVGLAAPEPAIIQKAGDWTVDVTFEHPQQIMVRGGGGGKPARFWYTILTLTNKTSRDVDFYPECELLTDGFQILPAGRGVAAGVFERIKRRHQSRYPFLESLEKAGNRILQGEDNTKDVAIMWPDFEAQAKNIRVFVAGLSNETAAVEHPITKGKVYLRKTLELSYELQGEPALRSYAKLVYKGKRWVMR